MSFFPQIGTPMEIVQGKDTKKGDLEKAKLEKVLFFWWNPLWNFSVKGRAASGIFVFQRRSGHEKTRIVTPNRNLTYKNGTILLISLC